MQCGYFLYICSGHEPFPSPHSIRNHMPLWKLSLESQSQTQVWEAECFAHLFSDSTKVDSKYELGHQNDLGLTLGSIVYWLHVPKQVIYPQLSLGFLDNRKMHNLPYQMGADLKPDLKQSTRHHARPREHLQAAHHSHHLLSFGAGQPEKQCDPEECLPSGQGGGYYKETARTHEKKEGIYCNQLLKTLQWEASYLER